MQRLASISVTLLLLTLAGIIDGKPCSTKELSVFNDVSGQVNKCLQDSKLNFQVPPTSSLSKTQQTALCKSTACQEMIGAVDDLDIPRCEAAFDKKNMTLQASLDKFVSSCDTLTPAPSPIKRRKFESSSSGSDSSKKNSDSSKKNKYSNAASSLGFEMQQQLAALLLIGMLSLAFVLP